MGPPTIDATRFTSLAERMELLSSPVRLAILHALRTPRTVSDIVVSGTDGERRPLARQTITWHLDQLVDASLVRRMRTEERSPLYVLDHRTLFATVDGMRQLSRLRPIMEVVEGQVHTRADLSTEAVRLPKGPRLLVAYGRDEGVAFPLEGQGPWTVGREPGCGVVLDYDPFASSEHARIERTGDQFEVVDLGSRNGTWVNGEPIVPEHPQLLDPGAVLTLGRSQLVFQP